MSKSFRNYPLAWGRRGTHKPSLHGVVRTKNRNRLAKAVREGSLDEFIPATLRDAGLDFDDPVMRSPFRWRMLYPDPKEMEKLLRK